MRVAITGASGLIGSALRSSLHGDGHHVVRFVRRQPRETDEASWDPEHHEIDTSGLAGVDAVVHLAGAGIGDRRWTEAHKQRVLDSRVAGTTTLCEALASLSADERPAVLVSASGVDFYGSRGDAVLTEDSEPGDGFLARVCQAWEAATKPASDAGVRVVHLRTSIVMAPKGGAFGRLFPLFRLGLGGRLGSGNQFWPWIHIGDEVGLIRHAIETPAITGALNAGAPEPVRVRDLARTIGRVLRRPAVVPAPAFALRLVLGREMADELLLGSRRMVPAKALATGYAYAHPELQGALSDVLGKDAEPGP